MAKKQKSGKQKIAQCKRGEQSLPREVRDQVKSLTKKSIYTSGQLEKLINAELKVNVKKELILIRQSLGIKDDDKPRSGTGKGSLLSFKQNLIQHKIDQEVESKQAQQGDKNKNSSKVKFAVDENNNQIVESVGADGDHLPNNATASVLKNTPATGIASFSSNKPAGLQNIGNTCFMNSTFQCLANLNDFRIFLTEYLDSDGKAIIGCPFAVRQVGFTRPFQAILRQIKSSKQAVNTTVFYKILATEFPQFKGRRQQDSHEFFTNCLSKMKEDENKTCMSSILKKYGLNMTTTKDSLSKEKVNNLKLDHQKNKLRLLGEF